MKFVSYKDLYEMVVNCFEGLDEDEIMLAVMRRNERDPILKEFDSYLTPGTHRKAKPCRTSFPCPGLSGKENSVTFHGDGCLWAGANRSNADQLRPDGLNAAYYVIDEMLTDDEIKKFKKCRRDGWCACHSDPYRKNEESTHPEKEVEERPLKYEEETKTNDEKFSSLEKFGIATNWASAMTMINARKFLQEVSDALCEMAKDVEQHGPRIEEPKKDILKVKCMKGCKYALVGNSMFTTGKVYERVNGVLVDDAGLKWTVNCESDNPAEWNFKYLTDAEFELYEEPKEEPKKDILKVRCVHADAGCTLFVEGEVYERVDGVLLAEDAFPFKYLCRGDDPMKWRFPEYRFELYEEPVEKSKKDILKVKCVWTDRPTWWTVGKVYERVDHKLIDEDGWPYLFKVSDNDPAKWTFRHAKFELYEDPKVEPKKDILKVKCVRKVKAGPFDYWTKMVTDSFTVGEIYQRVDGLLVDDDGDEWVYECEHDDPTEWEIDGVEFELYEEPSKDILWVKCTEAFEGSMGFIKGKIYKRVDGVLVDETGFPFKHRCSHNDPSKWDFYYYKFELAE